jgi:hypothetical protein
MTGQGLIDALKPEVWLTVINVLVSGSKSIKGDVNSKTQL